jgi:hypothetical protein
MSATVRPIDRLWRLWAAGCAAVVLALACSSVTPAIHGLFHPTGDPPTVDADDCAVVLFATTAMCPVSFGVSAPDDAAFQASVGPDRSELLLVSARYLRQPERGPPGLV